MAAWTIIIFLILLTNLVVKITKTAYVVYCTCVERKNMFVTIYEYSKRNLTFFEFARVLVFVFLLQALVIWCQFADFF